MMTTCLIFWRKRFIGPSSTRKLPAFGTDGKPPAVPLPPPAQAPSDAAAAATARIRLRLKRSLRISLAPRLFVIGRPQIRTLVQEVLRVEVRRNHVELARQAREVEAVFRGRVGARVARG